MLARAFLVPLRTGQRRPCAVHVYLPCRQPLSQLAVPRLHALTPRPHTLRETLHTSSMNLRSITITCECGGRYEIIRSASRTRQRLVFDFAICPCCLKPRLTSVWFPGDRDNRCDHCGIPFRLSTFKAAFEGARLCNTCHVTAWRLAKRRALANVISHGGS
jgi:hypothetical protein